MHPVLPPPPSAVAAPPVEASIVVPLCNEQGTVAELVERVRAAVDAAGIDAELILVDDGSSDGTWEQIRRATEAWPRVRGLRLSRNFGHQHALVAGLTHARGRAIVTMDGDLQHPPEVIPQLVARWREGYRIVMTRREDRGVASPWKRVSSSLYYRLFSAATGVEMSDGSSDLRLIDASVLDQILRFNDHDIFLRGMVQWVGFDSATVAFRADPRREGRSKYTLRRMMRLGAGALVSFTTRPLRAALWLGLFATCFALAEFVYVLYAYLSGRTVTGWSSIVALISLLFGWGRRGRPYCIWSRKTLRPLKALASGLSVQPRRGST